MIHVSQDIDKQWIFISRPGSYPYKHNGIYHFVLLEIINIFFRQWRVQVQVLRLFYPGGLIFHWYAISIDTEHKVQSSLGG